MHLTTPPPPWPHRRTVLVHWEDQRKNFVTLNKEQLAVVPEGKTIFIHTCGQTMLLEGRVPELDTHFAMSPKDAEKLLARLI